MALSEAEAVLAVVTLFPGTKVEGTITRRLQDEVIRLAARQSAAAYRRRPMPAVEPTEGRLL